MYILQVLNIEAITCQKIIGVNTGPHLIIPHFFCIFVQF